MDSHSPPSDCDTLGTVTPGESVNSTNDASKSTSPSLQAKRDALAVDPGWAASPNLPTRLCWIADGNRDRLVWRHDLYRARTLGKTPKDIVPNAELTIIGHIAPDDYWLDVPDIGPCDPATVLESSLICMLTCLNDDHFQADFNHALANLSQLADDPSVVGAMKRRVICNDDGVTKLRLRHIPFVVCVRKTFDSAATHFRNIPDNEGLV